MDNELNKEARLELIGMMAKFFRFLLSLDIYTLGLVCQTVAPPDDEPVTIKTLSRLRGCSRQAIHRKILDSIQENPELSALFAPLLRRISSAKQSFVLKKIRQGV
ncbi:MAG: hypothetical protein E7051_05020 [Lentisphaerae bacterium]|nr:hypothetical protein [Lentisphaerota bacterium]MBR2720776.1 hypothetical protein [Lentisphaeria bacterium]